MPPRHAISSRTDSGAHTRFSKEGKNLGTAIEVNGDGLHMFYEAAATYIAREPAPKGWQWLHDLYEGISDDKGAFGGRSWAENRARRGMYQSSVLLDMAKRSNVLGHVVYTSYVEDHDTGRLQAQGTLNLQGCMREIRKVALAGMWDVDLDCAHYAILSHMAASIDVKTPAIDHYILSKNEVRQSVGKSAGSHRSAKEVLTALIYGASLDPVYGKPGELEHLVGKEAIDRIRSNPFLQTSSHDLRKASLPVADHSCEISKHKGESTILLPSGRELGIRGKKTSSILSGILSSAESEILRACIGSGIPIQLCCHDGFVSAYEVDIPALQEHVLAKTGLSMTFTQQQL